jgi:hypothetical protein
MASIFEGRMYLQKMVVIITTLKPVKSLMKEDLK